MSISKLSKPGRWVEIASSTPSSGATVTFSSLPAYDRLRLLAKDIRLDTGANLWMRFNSDTGTNYVTFTESASTYNTDKFVISADDQYSCDFYIDFANQSTYKVLRGRTGEYISTSSRYGIWFNTATITSIDIISNGGNFTTPAGEFKLFGAND